jgi:amino acid adenylation domain-containing protein
VTRAALMSDVREAAATHGQRAIWTLQRIDPALDTYSGGYAVTVDEPLEPALLERAVNATVLRHESLRTTFGESAGRLLVQRIHPWLAVPIEWNHIAPTDDATLLDRLVTDSRRPFDLEHGPLLRVSVYARGDREHVVLLAGHHITLDLLSMRLLMEEFEERYVAMRRGAPDGIPALPCQFRDHAVWQNAMLEDEAGRRHEEYWRERLAGDAPDLAMPLDHMRPPTEIHRGASWRFELPADLVAHLEQIARQADSTLYAVLLAGFAVLLHRYSGESEITVGSFSSGRVRRDLKLLAGLVSNPIPLRVRLVPELAFVDLVRTVGRLVRGAFRHQFYPLALMAERLQSRRDAARSSLFQAALNLDRDAPLRLTCPSWRHDPWVGLLLRNQEGQFELRLMTSVRRDGSLDAALQYQTDLYEPDTAGRLAGAWKTLLKDAAQDPRRRVGALRLLDHQEERRIGSGWNQTDRDYPREAGVHELIRQQIDLTPGAIAVCHDTEAVTCAQLGRRVAGLTERLRAHGAACGSIIGVCLEPSIEQVVTLLAVLETGAAYLPLDPSHPRDRRRSMLEDAGAALLVGRGGSVEGLAASRVLSLDHLAGVPERDPPPQGARNGGGARRAYVLFTSGSTGRPKAVEISHRSLVNLLTAMRSLLEIGPGDVWLSVTTLSFDIAALEVFLPLLCGARLVMADRGVAGNGLRLVDEIERHGVTVVQATPTSWRLLQAASRRPSRPLTRLCGGEPLTRALAAQLLRDPGPVWNLYGPTETTIWSTASLVVPGSGPPPIGRPLANTQVYVLDRAMRPVPVGVTGELWIGGDGVALGYLGQRALTAERFVADPFRPGPEARLYRTGDLARWLRSGELEFVGRIDHQIKVRGIRIEPGEIEAALLEQPELAEAVVVARGGNEENTRLAAYVVPRPDRTPDCAVIRQTLRARLPDYMVPASFTILDALPLTPNRKIDRGARPDPAPESPTPVPFVPARSPVERELARLAAEILGLERVGIDDDFFELGGASIASLDLAARAELESGIAFSPEAVFEFRTIRRLAAALPDCQGCVSGGNAGHASRGAG